MKNPNHAKQSGFTLVELILAMTIMALVVGSVYSVMRTSMDAFTNGQYTMELYQSARIGLRRITEELRYALSPLSFWRPQDRIRDMALNELMATFNGPVIEEEDPGAILFTGQKQSVLFVRKVYQLEKYPPFDLQECRIYVDGEQKLLILEVVRSLLEVKQATWMFQQEFKANLNGFVVPMQGERVRVRPVGPNGEPPLDQYIGNRGMINKRYVLAEGVKSINFRFNAGEGWQSNWDSQQLEYIYRIPPNSPSFNHQRDVEIIEKGPPKIVEIFLELENGEKLITSADVPAGNMRSKGLFGRGGAQGAPAATRPRNETATNVPGTPSFPQQNLGGRS